MTFDDHEPPTPEEIRATGWTGDVTRFPLTLAGFRKRCAYNGIEPHQVPNSAWFYAPNAVVQKELNG